MTPAERHTLVAQLQAAGLSARAACRYVGCSRRVASYPLTQPTKDQARLRQVQKQAGRNPRYGYRRVAVVSGLGMGQTWRLWKRYHFRLAPQRQRPQRRVGTAAPRPHQATYPRHVWTYDLLFDHLADGRTFKVLSVLDEFTRECVAQYVAFTIQVPDILPVLQQAFRQYGAPAFLRSDNGSEFTAQDMQSWLAHYVVGPTFIPPGQPWQNGFIESFHDKFRDECLNREWFTSLADAQVTIEKWRRHYNTRRPHSALDYRTPASFAAQQPSHRARSLTSRGNKK
jgi:transposase InsO family protein